MNDTPLRGMANVLANHIESHMDSELAKILGGDASQAIVADFCQMWPLAKPVLEPLVDQLQQPLAGEAAEHSGITVRAMMHALLRLADEIHGAACPSRRV
jgi:hypothetical protein